MKKVFSILIVAGLLVTFIVPQAVVLAQDDTFVETCTVQKGVAGTEICGKSGVNTPVNIQDFPMCCLLGAIYRVTDWIFLFLMALVVLFVLLGALNLLTAAGEPEKISKGRNYILWAAIGFLVALIANAVPALAKLVVGF